MSNAVGRQWQIRAYPNGRSRKSAAFAGSI
jgi:hypothetical protein